MTYSASVEWLDPARRWGILRIHQGPGGKLGDPYAWSCFLARVGPDEVEIKGVCVRPPIGVRSAFVEALRLEGFRRYTHDRHPGTDRARAVDRVITRSTK